MSEPIKPMATIAMNDLIAFVALTKDIPAAADALKECFEFSIPIVQSDIDHDATRIAGKFIFKFYLNERLKRFLPAVVAPDAEHGLGERVI